MKAVAHIWERKIAGKYYCPLCGKQMRRVSRQRFMCTECGHIWELTEVTHDGIPCVIRIVSYWEHGR